MANLHQSILNAKPLKCTAAAIDGTTLGAQCGHALNQTNFCRAVSLRIVIKPDRGHTG